MWTPDGDFFETTNTNSTLRVGLQCNRVEISDPGGGATQLNAVPNASPFGFACFGGGKTPPHLSEAGILFVGVRPLASAVSHKWTVFDKIFFSRL